MYSKIEQSTLHWIGSEEGQRQIKADKYKEFADALAKGNLSETGKPIILPSTYTGSPRWYNEQYEDTMATVREYGPPSYFITMTLLRDLTEKEIFGKVVAHMSTQEWQKRTTPHSHLLLIMHDHYKPKTSREIDKFVSAEIPPKELDPVLHDIIKKFNIHSPCEFLDSGKPDKTRYCRELKDTCKDRFPKDYQNFTVVTENAYPF